MSSKVRGSHISDAPFTFKSKLQNTSSRGGVARFSYSCSYIIKPSPPLLQHPTASAFSQPYIPDLSIAATGLNAENEAGRLADTAVVVGRAWDIYFY